MKVVEGLARLKWMHAINFRDIIHDAKKQRNYKKKLLCSYISIIKSSLKGKSQFSLKDSHYRNDFVNEGLYYEVDVLCTLL